MTATTPREMIQAMPLNIAKPLAVAYCQWCMQRALAAADKVQHLMPADGQRLYEELKENIRTGTGRSRWAIREDLWRVRRRPRNAADAAAAAAAAARVSHLKSLADVVRARVPLDVVLCAFRAHQVRP